MVDAENRNDGTAVFAALAKVCDALDQLESDEQRCAVMGSVCLRLGEYEHAATFARFADEHREKKRRATR